MPTKFYDGKDVRIELNSSNLDLNVYVSDKSEYSGVEARLYFPLSDNKHYVSIVKVSNENGKFKEEELFVITDVENLDENSREVLDSTLNKFYMISKIVDIYDSKKVANIVQWKVLTDKGECSITIKDIFSSIKKLPDGRIFVTDASDNKYEITDVEKLPSKGRKLILSYL